MLTVAEAARRLEVSAQRVRQLCAAGRLPGAIKAGRSWRIPAESLALLQAGRKEMPGGREEGLPSLAVGLGDRERRAPRVEDLSAARLEERAARAEQLEFEVVSLRLELAERRAAQAEALAQHERREAASWRAAFAALLAARADPQEPF